jgi:tripartite-type tricarboxylate transporter receptor subunit TctC
LWLWRVQLSIWANVRSGSSSAVARRPHQGRQAAAVTTATRSEALPDLPTVGDFLPGYETSAWFGIGAPRDTPAGIIDKLNKEINAGLADPRIKARFADLAATVFMGSPTDFAKFIADDTEKWAKVIRTANIKPE